MPGCTKGEEDLLLENGLEGGCRNEVSRIENQKVLGLAWNPASDDFSFVVRLNFSPRRRRQRTGPDLQFENIPSENPICLTKRMILSQVHGIYDPMGLACTFHSKSEDVYEKSLEWRFEATGLG